MSNIVKGFKGFNQDLQCRGFQYKVGETYETDQDIKLCDWGFHFCRRLFDVHEYYDFNDENNRFCEIEAIGEVIDSDDESVTNKIKIVREISREEFIEIANIGNKNSGYCNTGDRNTGDWNKTDRSTGVFCTAQPKLIMFNKETDMTFEEWRNTKAYDLLLMVQKTKWVSLSDMTDDEKKEYSSAETCGGYLKELTREESSHEWWKKLNKYDKRKIFTLPNFDLEIFNEIMELKITKEEYKQVMEVEH